ncbi:phosphatidylcholine/phosphatidylserine synthase [Thermopetrobacter sp. TC1]|uniref:CDP-alcohol phosphatidyltransferase family protein n=1 Tax=Thermopetrobacter sp. TC1 TaxID=1495045 RepID=UPI00068C190A|nr:phosphatidylcholine/phosphatidylserine synthase [Thermopetrobacter sp. TC1]
MSTPFRLHRSDRHRQKERRLERLKRIPVRILLPNLVTLLAVSSGVTAIRLGMEGRFQLAVGAVILATVLDAMDGRLARLLKGTSRFGAELDSLADFVNFGVTPAILIYLWSLNALGNLGWIAALALAIACALRLARFNVMLDDPDMPAWKKGFFVGIPAPAGALLAISPMYLGFLGLFADGHMLAPYVLPWVVLVALGMISRLPTFSGKTMGSRIPREWVIPLLAGLVFALAMLIAYPWHTMLIATAAYVISLPYAVRSWKRHEKAQATAADEAATKENRPHQADAA